MVRTPCMRLPISLVPPEVRDIFSNRRGGKKWQKASMWRMGHALFRGLRLQAGVFLVGQALQRRQHLAREQPDVLLGEAAREARELQQREKILEAEQAMRIHQLLAHGIGTAAEHDPLLDERVDGVFLPRYRALVAQHVLQRLGAEIAGRKYHLERLSQELVE